MYTSTYIYMHTHTQTHAHARTHTRTCTHTRAARAQTHAHRRTRTHAHIHIHQSADLPADPEREVVQVARRCAAHGIAGRPRPVRRSRGRPGGIILNGWFTEAKRREVVPRVRVVRMNIVRCAAYRATSSQGNTQGRRALARIAACAVKYSVLSALKALRVTTVVLGILGSHSTREQCFMRR